MTPEELFQQRIYESLKVFLGSSPGSIIILLPGIRDLISQHAVYPQGELSSDLIQNDPVSPIYYLHSPIFIDLALLLFVRESTLCQILRDSKLMM